MEPHRVGYNWSDLAHTCPPKNFVKLPNFIHQPHSPRWTLPQVTIGLLEIMQVKLFSEVQEHPRLWARNTKSKTGAKSLCIMSRRSEQCYWLGTIGEVEETSRVIFCESGIWFGSWLCICSFRRQGLGAWKLAYSRGRFSHPAFCLVSRLLPQGSQDTVPGGFCLYSNLQLLGTWEIQGMRGWGQQRGPFPRGPTPLQAILRKDTRLGRPRLLLPCFTEACSSLPPSLSLSLSLTQSRALNG